MCQDWDNYRAITGVIDRLERAGDVHRLRNENDRRKVTTQPLDEKTGQDLGLFFVHME